MRTFSTILTLIYFISFARIIKSTAYSEIIYNIVDISGDNSFIPSIIEVQNAFKESKQKLNAYDEELSNKCTWSMRSGQLKTQGMTFRIMEAQQTLNNFEEQKNQLAVSSNQAHEKIEANKQEIEDLKIKIHTEDEFLSEQETEIGIRANVYKRLLNFIEDELVAEKRNTDMNKFNVDNSFSGKTSFVELQRIRNDLVGISNKSRNTIAKSWITTLLMLTESNKKALFADPEIVQKIKNLISNLISLEKEHLQEVRNNHESVIVDLRKLITEKVNDSEVQNETILKNKAEEESLNYNINSMKNEIAGLEKAREKAGKKYQVQLDLCQKQQELAAKHQTTLMMFESHFLELLNEGFTK